MSKLCVIGSSSIISKHLVAAKANKFKLFSISSTRKNSLNSKNLKRKFKIRKYISDWKKCVDESAKNKDVFFLIAPRVRDTIKVLNYVLKYKRPVLVEKPITIFRKNFDKIKRGSILVGYNRIFYKTVNHLKKYNFKNSLITVVCPEKNTKTFMSNSCHIVSILLYLFNDLKLIKKKKRKNFVFCSLIDKNNNLINFNIVFKTSTNFSIKIKNKETVFELSPIEELKIFKGVKIIKKKNMNIYEPKLKKKIDDYHRIYKPGFYEQFNYFKKIERRVKINSVNFAKKVIALSEKLI